nr:hypothetical protein CFP56_52858 [Quercus suber]
MTNEIGDATRPSIRFELPQMPPWEVKLEMTALQETTSMLLRAGHARFASTLEPPDTEARDWRSPRSGHHGSQLSCTLETLQDLLAETRYREIENIFHASLAQNGCGQAARRASWEAAIPRLNGSKRRPVGRNVFSPVCGRSSAVLACEVWYFTQSAALYSISERDRVNISETDRQCV